MCLHRLICEFMGTAGGKNIGYVLIVDVDRWSGI